MTVEGKKGKAPLVVAAVLTWNDTEMTAECLRSVFANDYSNLQVVLVDNGSSEPCGLRLKEQFPDIDLVVLPENRGFTGGANQCLKRGLDLGADYVQLIGNDSVLAPTVIGNLVRELESNKQLGAASPLILYPGGDTVQFYYATLDRNQCKHVHHEFGARLDSRTWPTRESEFIPYIAMMFRSKALQEVGLLDETLGTCWEDYDHIVRLSDAGWSLLMVTDTSLEHRSGGTTGRQSPYIIYYLTRNHLICLFRHAESRDILRNSPKTLRSMVRKIRNNGTNWEAQRAYFKGVTDFLMGVRGTGKPPVNRRGIKKP